MVHHPVSSDGSVASGEGGGRGRGGVRGEQVRGGSGSGSEEGGTEEVVWRGKSGEVRRRGDYCDSIQVLTGGWGVGSAGWALPSLGP